MSPFIIEYTEGGEICLAQWSGWNADHAEERFMDSMEDEGGTQGVRVISVVRAVEFRGRGK